MKQTIRCVMLMLVSTLSLAPVIEAQEQAPAVPVRYTEARQARLRRSLDLTGSVESRRSSMVASEVEGLVEKLAAREGDRVEKGAPLVELRRQNIALRHEAMQGQLKEAEARQQLALTSLDRSQGLFEEGIISQQQLDDAASEYEAWQGRVAQLKADVARLEDDLDRTIVRAPYAGVVVEEHVAEGEWLQEGGDVVEMVDFRDLEVTVEAPESYFDGLSTGDKAQVEIRAIPGFVVEGVIRAVVPRAVRDTGPSRSRWPYPTREGGSVSACWPGSSCRSASRRKRSSSPKTLSSARVRSASSFESARGKCSRG